MTDAGQDKPDLTNGVSESELTDGATLVGQVGDDAVLLARRGGEIFAIGATCTHYGGQLGEGLIVEDTVRCPWHHACFSLRTGEALAAPALNATSCWRIEQRDGRIFVHDKIPEVGQQMPATLRPTDGPSGRMVIIGGGGAGNAAAEMLRREGYAGGVTIISDDAAAPYDRPNLSKDYLAGTAPEEWIPLRPPEFYADNGIELRLGTTATAIDIARRHVMLGGGEELGFDKLLLATDAEPIRLQVPGADLPHVRTLRSLADSRDLIARAPKGSHAVVVGASFIGLEAAAALRHRQVEVHVVAPEARPMERVLGPELGDFVRQLHESHGVVFHLGHTVGAIEAGRVRLDNGVPIDADLVVVGIGVRPRIHLAQQAGLVIDRGVLVNNILKPARPGFSPPETSPAGPTPTAASSCASSTGSLPSGTARLQRAICSAGASATPPFRSSGASTTTCRSITSATPMHGTRLFRTAIRIPTMQRCASAKPVARWPSRRSSAAVRAYWRKPLWNEAGRRRFKKGFLWREPYMPLGPERVKLGRTGAAAELPLNL